MKNASHQPLRIRVRASTSAALAAAGLLLCGTLTQAQPTISGIYPDGKHLFEAASSLSFTASSSLGVAGISVALHVTSLTGVTYLENLSVGNGVTVSGTPASETASVALSANTLYAATIQVTDTGGNTTIATASFDTVNPSYVFEAEDWDYTTTNGGTAVTGLFINNPQTNGYAGLYSTLNTDFFNNSIGSGNASYRPQGMETETTSDTPRLPYIGTGFTDYDVGFNNGGEWMNYTRNFPKGLYNIYGRLADGNGPQTDCASMTVLASAGGNAAFIATGAAPYNFSVKSTGWQTFGYYPLLDASQGLVQFTNDGTAATIQVHTDGGNYNANFYMFVPVDTNAPSPSSVEFTNAYPDGATQFQPSSNLSVTVISAAPILPPQVLVQLTGTNLLGQSSSTIYTPANGLTVAGSETNFSVSVPLVSNTVYSAFIQVVDANGNPASTTLNFDTISPVYTWEAEDWDYQGGSYVDNPQTNAYYGLDGLTGVDYYVDDPTHAHPYRQNDNNATGGLGPETEGCGDIPRVQYTNSYPGDINPVSGIPYQDYDVGFNDAPNWMNYTRHYPNGTFNIYVRGANGGGGAGTASMALVTGGLGTANQTITNLGTFSYPSTGNWQSYVFSPLLDNSGNLVKVTFGGGGPETLRGYAPSSGNINFYMLVPADTSLPVIGNLYPNGLSFFQRTNALSFVALSSAGIATSNILVTVNGNNVSNLVITGSSTSWNVSTPLQLDSVYTASISVKSDAGASLKVPTYSFDTYSPAYYQWESADYDYTSNSVSGLFFDNPRINAYNQLGAASGIDELEVTAGAPLSEDVYRTNEDGSLIICTQSGGDLPRAQFGTNATWRINWFGYGDFANYTRHYPAGTYNVLARFTEGGSASSATLWKVTDGEGTTNQVTTFLGEWTVPVSGWGGWEWETLSDTNGTALPVTLDGSKTTLQLQGPLVSDGQTINVGFFMLVPVPSSSVGLTATLSAGNINISFPTSTGKNYQVLYKSSLNATVWTPLGSPLPGNNAVQSVQYPATGGQGFYRVQIQ